MKKAFGCLMVIGFVILAYVFFLMWRGESPLGVGTGSIGAPSGARSEAGSTSGAKPANKGSAISQIASDPQKWQGKHVTVSGRVRGNTRYASNRNLYRLTDGKSSLLIVDDKTPPKELDKRSVKGIVKVVKPPVGEGYAYVVSAKGDPKIEWKDAQGFFSDKFEEIKKGVNSATS